MKEILFFKGKYKIITRPEFAPKAKKFYNKLFELFEFRGFNCKKIESNSKKQVKSYISNETSYLVGHSKGATRILKEFAPKQNPQIKGVVLFDPKQTYKEEYNKLHIPKLLFVSTINQSQNYSGFKDIIKINDDHYFNNSKQKVFPIIKKFIQKPKD